MTLDEIAQAERIRKGIVAGIPITAAAEEALVALATRIGKDPDDLRKDLNA